MFLSCNVFLLGSALPTYVALRVQVSYNVTNSGQLTSAITKFTNLTENCHCIRTGNCNVSTAVGHKVVTAMARRAVDGFQLIAVILCKPFHGESPRHGNCVFIVLDTHYINCYRYLDTY